MSANLQLCTFSVHDRRFGIDIADVCEIHHGASLRPVPQSPECIAGLVNIRGHVHLICDLRILMGYPPNESERPTSRLLLFKKHIARDFGLLIEGDQDIVSVPTDSIIDRRKQSEQDPANNDERRQARSGLVTGVCMAVDPLLLVLKATALAAAPQDNLVNGLAVSGIA